MVTGYAALSDPDFWYELPAGSIVRLTDEQAVQEAKEKGRGKRGLEYEVGDIVQINEATEQVQWRLFELVDDEESLWLMVRTVGDELEVRVYFEDEEAFESGTRAEQVEREEFWLFRQPEDEDDWEPADLEFTSRISWDFEDGKGTAVFSQKPQGQLYGSFEVMGEDIGPLPASVIEYYSPDAVDNNEIVIIETGGVDPKTVEMVPEGGFVRVMFGCVLDPDEIEVEPQ